jgi:glutamate synthase (ferredoxin)
MRMVGHNGEINTLLGNINWVRAREAKLGVSGDAAPDASELDARDAKSFIEMHDIQDDGGFEALVDNGKSDSANLDSVFELLVQVRGA